MRANTNPYRPAASLSSTYGLAGPPPFHDIASLPESAHHLTLTSHFYTNAYSQNFPSVQECFNKTCFKCQDLTRLNFFNIFIDLHLSTLR